MSAAAETVAAPATHESTVTRAPRLTENRLDDLDVALLTLDVEIGYLAEAALEWPTTHPMRSRLQSKHDALQRARGWIACKVLAERAKRGDA